MKLRLAIILIFAAALSRLLPHPFNFSPIGAIGLFSAAYFSRNWLMLTAPFIALWTSDFLLNNFFYGDISTGITWFTHGEVWITGAFILCMLLGWAILNRTKTAKRIFISSLLTSAIFFTVTNFAVWYDGLFYPANAAGLSACFVAGLPFLGNTITGDLFFSAVLFGSYAWAERHLLDRLDWLK